MGVQEPLGKCSRLFLCSVQEEADYPCAADGNVFELHVLAYQDENRSCCLGKGSEGVWELAGIDRMTVVGPVFLEMWVAGEFQTHLAVRSLKKGLGHTRASRDLGLVCGVF